MYEFPELDEPRPFTAAEQQAIDDLKLMFKQNAEINFQTDNYFLTKFLRYRDWNVEAAYKSIVNYYELKRDNPLVHADKNISEYIDLLNLNTRVVLDKRDKNGRIVFVSKLGNVGPNIDFIDAAVVDDAWMQLLLSDPLTQMNGFCCITDCKGLDSSLLKWLIPKNCKVGAAKLESLPIKQWTIHVVNMNTLFKAAVYVIKPFLRKSTIAKFKFHTSGYTDLIDELGENCVPAEYGGKNGKIDYDKSLKFILSREKLLAQNRIFGFKKQ